MGARLQDRCAYDVQLRVCGWLTEANHLGNVAFRVGKKLEWDAEAMNVSNAPEAERYLRREPREGWKLA